MPARFASVGSSFPSLLQVFSASSSALLFPSMQGEQPGEPGLPKRGYLLLSQPAEREHHAPEVSSKRDGGGDRGFYCLEASDPDLPSTSPMELLHCYLRGPAGIKLLASWQPFRTVAH